MKAIAIVVATAGFNRYVDRALRARAWWLWHRRPSPSVGTWWNHLFEMWEARRNTRGRGIGRRIAHALGMEGGLVFILVPLFAWWFDVNLWQALVMDIGLLLLLHHCYTFVFNWSFDRIFGLPRSAQ